LLGEETPGLTVAKFNINNHALPQTYTVPGPPVFKGSAMKARDFTA
jgi:hypothetical protein